MAQKTTEQFSERLARAVEGYPLAPPTPHGRVTWLMRELEKQIGVKVSLNTAHKWMTGASRPREDRVRDLARMLRVDEIWLAFGKAPTATPVQVESQAHRARGATLLVAGLIEVCGGRVSFADDGKSLSVSHDGVNFGLVPVVGQVSESKISFVVPEPVGDSRVVAVVPNARGAFDVDLLDATRLPRQNFGGFSVFEVHIGARGSYKQADGTPLPRVTSVQTLAAQV